MKIGILTFHSQLNYGGVLQCWALQEALTRLFKEKVKSKSEKVEMEVVDHWLSPDNWRLERGYNRMGWKAWVKFWVKALLGLGVDQHWLRTKRTQKFVRGKLNLTPFHFCGWEELGALGDRALPLGGESGHAVRVTLPDLLVVGSDQVWNPSWAHTRFYLCEGAGDVKRISYAVSIGVKSLEKKVEKVGGGGQRSDFNRGEHKEKAEWPSWVGEDVVEGYRKALGKFAAISCREEEACEIVRNLGFEATHVVDPTLLLTKDEWLSLIKNGRVDRENREKSVYRENSTRSTRSTRLKNLPALPIYTAKKLVCYFLSEDVEAARPLLEKFAKEQNCRVEILIGENSGAGMLPLPISPSRLRRWLGGLCRRFFSRVHVNIAAGPLEFVRLHAEATWIVTDSFHSVMFSTIFGKNCRALAPKVEWRKDMFARIEEIAEHAHMKVEELKGCKVEKLNSFGLIANDLTEALNSFRRGNAVTVDQEWVAKRRSDSIEWLKEAINA